MGRISSHPIGTLDRACADQNFSPCQSANPALLKKSHSSQKSEEVRQSYFQGLRLRQPPRRKRIDTVVFVAVCMGQFREPSRAIDVGINQSNFCNTWISAGPGRIDFGGCMKSARMMRGALIFIFFLT